MPTYQYVCTECATPLEAVQSFSDPALTECPACSGALRKVFSAVGVVFKGSGFYKTDSRSNGKSAAAASSSSSSDSGSGSSSGSGDGGSSTPASSNGSSGAKTESSGSGKSDSKPAAPTKAAATSS